MEAIAESQVLAENCIIAIESSKQERIDDQYKGLELLERKHFGDKALSLYRRA
jgi:16S rRNA G966 N2-methylase RsmD